ncbi:MAG TPA: gamma-glutamyltransferase [Candidatus Binataceae bacterium]|jgi:gamma-glutamyltranspeptidase/glutathione hydrolase|nr:gamma-glutamyltransferase [Candidatus Binataceae bacterium]
MSSVRVSSAATAAATRRALALILCAVLATVALGATSVPAEAAEARHAMVVAENALAASAGVEILRRGGNAVDAAVATSLAVGVTNPASCGIGGGGFMLIYIARTHSFYALDYRERAPMTASATMYVRNGKPDEELAQSGPLAVAVPGEIAGLDAALRRFGTVRFSAAAAPAIRLAELGFPATPHLVQDIAHVTAQMAADPGLKAIYLTPEGAPPKPGDLVHEKALGETLRSLGDDPATRFYHGEIARTIAEWMKAHGGLVTEADLAQYRPAWRAPLHRAYRGYEVWTMPPPSSGGVVLEILGMLAGAPVSGLGVNSPPYLARLIEVMRQGFIDRAQYADPDFVHVPIDILLSQHHIDQALQRALHRATPAHVAPASDHGTSNLLVVDKDGNVVAVTTTINTIFGAKMMIASLGLVLNDEMDDFAAGPGVRNAFNLEGAAANEIAPGKRPLSSMSPTIVMRRGHPVLTVGASGGPAIITGVLQVTVNVLDFHLGPQAAIDEPRVHQQATPDVVFVEAAMPAATRQALAEMGYRLKEVPSLGAVGAITIAPGDLQGAFDARKGGGVYGL